MATVAGTTSWSARGDIDAATLRTDESNQRGPGWRQIAAIAAVRGLVLVTRNTADFERFDGLRLENWFAE